MSTRKEFTDLTTYTEKDETDMEFFYVDKEGNLVSFVPKTFSISVEMRRQLKKLKRK